MFESERDGATGILGNGGETIVAEGGEQGGHALLAEIFALADACERSGVTG